VILRAPEVSEFEALVSLWHEGWCDAHLALSPPELTRNRTPEVFAQRLARKWCSTIVAGEVGVPDGFAVLLGDELDQFYVARSLRGTGLAQNFMTLIEVEFLKRAVQRPWLICSVGNDRAARFYEKSGWENMGRRTGSVEVPGGTFDLPVWRFEKTVGAAGSGGGIVQDQG
jgi:GNAT superfamily N-acetyltransferase